MIIPRQANPNHALMKVGNDGNSILHVKIGLLCGSSSENHAPPSWHQRWKVRIQWFRYRGCTAGLTASIWIIASISHIVHEGLLKFLMLENRTDSRSAFNSERPHLNSISQCLVCRTIWGFKLQMERMMLKIAGHFSIPS